MAGFSAEFRELFLIIHNINKWDLVEAGVINESDESKWMRFNSDLTTFVLKLSEDRLEKFIALLQSKGSASQ